ncbi:hypothetical protein C1H76_6369 [Elsinoe australis]|uniref:Uncharacterized protein n=1 Tax=Elsinoe australis TaxID=40998 RepID=A0A4U7AVT1_9PEZI|nr:hypothetical protein C1H76_6369 [Elsinoe australis]
MRSFIFFAAALAGTSAASLVQRQSSDPCQDKYNQCLQTNSEVKCQCDLATCTGEDAARIRDFCATATASMSSASSTTTSFAPSSTATGTVALGEQCSSDSQCPAGVQCLNTPPLTPSAPTSVPRCGGFNAKCQNDSQCSLNTCNNGVCNGYRGGSSSSTTSSVLSSSSTTSSASTTSTTTSAVPIQIVKLGDSCSSDAQCPDSIKCYNNPPLTPSAPTAVPICGGFNATCTSDSQCALNTCIKGVCNGYKSSLTTTSSAASSSTTKTSISTSMAPSSSSTTPTTPAPPATSVVTYAAAALGEPCSIDAQCPSGVKCLNNPPLTPSAPTAAKICGGFNATCSSDSQCALNTCNNGLCNGYKSDVPGTTTVTTAGTRATTTSSATTRATTSPSVVAFPGAASKNGMSAAFVAAACALVYML